MPKLALTKGSIDKIPFTQKGQVDYWDTNLRGFALRVGQFTKTFFVQADVKDATKKKGYRTVKRVVGKYGEITLEQAKKFARGYIDEEGKHVPGALVTLKQTEPDKPGNMITLQEMLETYFKEKRRKSDSLPHKNKTVVEYTNIIERHFQSWLPLTLPEIAKLTPDTIIDRYKQIEVNNGPYAARNAFVMLSAVVSYATVKFPAAIPTNPFRTLRGNGLMAKVKERNECLHGNDFKVLHDGIQGFNPVTRDCYLFCLYQGMRSTEASSLRWEHVDLENKELRIPDTKNRQALHVPLSRQTIEILERRKSANLEDSPWVFPTQRKDLNKTGHTRMVSADLRGRTGLQITVHALRRTFITTGRKLKIYEDTDRLTNHVDGSVSGRHYDQTEVEDLRKPLQIITNEIERLMLEGIGAKVINFTGTVEA